MPVWAERLVRVSGSWVARREHAVEERESGRGGGGASTIVERSCGKEGLTWAEEGGGSVVSRLICVRRGKRGVYAAVV